MNRQRATQAVVDFLNSSLSPLNLHLELSRSVPPWEGDADFERTVVESLGTSLLGKAKLYTLYLLAQQALVIGGDYVEVGTFRGGSARLIAEALRKGGSHKTLHLFDTFTGLSAPDMVGDAGSPHLEGEMAATVKELKDRLQRTGYLHWQVHAGAAETTLASAISSDTSVSFAHLDLDLYLPTLVSLRTLLPRLSQGGVILVDDYSNRNTPGVRRAVNEAIEPGDGALSLPLVTGQFLLVRLGSRE